MPQVSSQLYVAPKLFAYSATDIAVLLIALNLHILQLLFGVLEEIDSRSASAKYDNSESSLRTQRLFEDLVTTAIDSVCIALITFSICRRRIGGVTFVTWRRGITGQVD